jgi:hypothetical protein
MRAFQKAGLDEFVGEWVGGAEYPAAGSPGAMTHAGVPSRWSTPTASARTARSPPTIRTDSRLTRGTYEIIDDRTLTHVDPPIPARFRIEDDTATFDAVLPNCKTEGCREAAAYVVSVFFPRTYKRAD